ncbi:hypothetical protein [Methylobacterium oryzisoli]|uniref:hypothetical protein n=1 Tax=Methylobacterium oryzisoli TaxID=3385502 RepID=UPI0038928587
MIAHQQECYVMLDRDDLTVSLRLIAELAEDLAHEGSPQLLRENYRWSSPTLDRLARAKHFLDAAGWPAGPALLETIEIASLQGGLPYNQIS